MKTIIVFAVLFAVAFAFPQKRQVEEAEKEVVMVRNTPSTYVGSDNYQFGYELSDGQMREESAQIEVQEPEKSVIRVKGSYSWYNPENGLTYLVTYIADENGFQPQGAHLPVVPSVPIVPVVPVAAEKVVPVAAETVVPVAAETVVPVAAETVVPVAAETVVSVAAETVVPVAAETVASVTAEPIVPDTAEPVVLVTVEPVVPDTAEPIV